MNKSMSNLRKVIIIFGIITILAVSWFLYAVDRAIRRGEFRNLQYKRTHTAGPVTADSIQTWMTFDYLNVIFKLPPTYLQTQLHITDARYPGITIGHYVKQNHVDQTQFIAQVRAAIINFQTVRSSP